MRRTLALAALILLACLLWWQLERAREAPERAPVRPAEAVPDDASGVPATPEPAPDAEPRLLLSGRVLDADGSPAGGAEVSTGWGGSAILAGGPIPKTLERYVWRATTDTEGRYRFFATRTRTRLPASLDVRARRGDRVAMPATVDQPEAPFEMEDLVLEDAFVARVRVSDGARRPVEGAHGLLAVFRDGVTEHRRLVATSDRAGLLAFFPLRRSAAWSLRLTVTHPRHPEVETRLELADQLAGKTAEVVLPLGVEIRGRVADPEGRPRPGVSVVAASGKEDALKAHWNLQSVSDAAGAFVVQGVPAGAGRLLLYPDLKRPASSFGTARRLPWLSEPFAGTEGGVVDLGTIVLHPAGAIRGRVIDPQGNPVGNATAGLEGAFRGLTSPWVLTKADGSFALESVPPGEYAVRASRSRGEGGVLEGEVPGVRPGGLDVVVHLRVKPGIVLRLFSAETPTERVAAESLSYSCRRTPHETSGMGGVRSRAPLTWYRLDRDPGVWYVRVSVPGYREVDFGRVILPEDRDLVLDVLLRKAE